MSRELKRLEKARDAAREAYQDARGIKDEAYCQAMESARREIADSLAKIHDDQISRMHGDYMSAQAACDEYLSRHKARPCSFGSEFGCSAK